MSLLSKIIKPFGRKGYDPSQAPQTKEERIYYQGMGAYGVRKASQIAAALRAGNVIASGMGSMPIQTKDTYLDNLLNLTPNELQTGVEFVEMMTMHAVFTGVGRAFVEKSGGRVRRLLPLLPEWCGAGWEWSEIEEQYVLPVHVHNRGQSREFLGYFTRDRILEVNSPRWDIVRPLDDQRVPECARVVAKAAG